MRELLAEAQFLSWDGGSQGVLCECAASDRRLKTYLAIWPAKLDLGGRAAILPAWPEEEVSFWYLANRLGEQFLGSAEQRLGPLERCSEGLWRAGVLGYQCLLVSIIDLPVDDDSLPLHVLGMEPAEKERQVGRFMAEAPQRLDHYSSVFATLHPTTWKELSAMARRKRKELGMDIRPAIEWIGLERAIEQIGEKEIIDQIGKKKVIQQLDIDDILTNLGPAKRRELKRRLEAESGKS